eukprot:874094-Prorocentrum_minimum.AAC.1
MTNQGQQPSFYPIGNPRSVGGLEGVWRGSGGGLMGGHPHRVPVVVVAVVLLVSAAHHARQIVRVEGVAEG